MPYRSTWGAGQNEIVQIEAERRFRALQDQELARQAQLDADRRTQTDLSNRRYDEQSRLEAEDRTFNRERLAKGDQEKADSKAKIEAREARVQSLLDQLTEARVAGSYDMVAALRAKLDAEGVNLPNEPNERIEVTGGASVYNTRTKKNEFTAPKVGGDGTGEPRQTAAQVANEDKLPLGVRQWIDSIVARGVPPEQAFKELGNGWQIQMNYHPKASIVAAGEYMNRGFQKDNLNRPTAMFSPGGGAPPPAAPPPAPPAAPPPSGLSGSFRDVAALTGGRGGNLGSLEEMTAGPVQSEANLRRGLEESQAQGFINRGPSLSASKPGTTRLGPRTPPAAAAPAPAPRAYTGEVRQAPDGRLLGMIDGQVVEVVQTPQGFVIK